jgi:hypothetical protein
MNIKIAVVCFYIMLIYSLTLHYPTLHSLFYPTLGAFSFLFISRTFDMKLLRRIAFGASLSSLIGSVMYMINPGGISLFIDALIIIFLINKFHWNAPPILAVSFIPYFSKTADWWSVPLSVGMSLFTLLFLLFIVHLIEQIWQARLLRNISSSDKAEV